MKPKARRYNNEAERLRAIAQAEKEGVTEWKSNQATRMSEDNCIVIGEEGVWYDNEFNEEHHQEIPLDPQLDPKPVAEKVTAAQCFLALINGDAASEWNGQKSFEVLAKHAHEAAKAFNEFEPKE